MQKKPSVPGHLTHKAQQRINRIIPEKVHKALTAAVRQTTRAVLFGAGYTTRAPLLNMPLEVREMHTRARIDFYKKTAALEGAATGFGGFVAGMLDFPLFLSIKMKLLFDLASLYGYDMKDYKERVYLLHIFQITFSSQQHRNKIYKILADWTAYQQSLPADINQFNWRDFQQEYRDYLDIAKLLQIVPVVGAPVGAYVNHRLTNKLGVYAMNAYRLRIL